MITYALAVNRSWFVTHVMLIFGLSLLSLDAFAGEARLSVSTQSTRAERDIGAEGRISEDEFEALLIAGDGALNKDAAARSKSTVQASQSANTDFWFYTADVELFNDHDGDGYFHGIDLLFDADTYHVVADVYAVVYLSLEDGPWNEYAATENFSLFGASSDDDYVIVTELLAGYPSGSYDILIELFDAYDDSFLAWIGPEDTSELAFLPLEDADRDIAELPEVIVVSNDHGGGSSGLVLILALALSAIGKSRRERFA